MPIAVTADQRALADAVRQWAARTRPVATARAQEHEPESWRELWAGLAALGPFDLDVPPVHRAVALEQAAAALTPGPVLPGAVLAAVLAEGGEHPDLAADLASGSATAGLALGAGAPVLGGGAVLVVTDEGCRLVEPAAGAAKVLDLPAADFSRGVGELHGDAAGTALAAAPQRVRDLVVTFAAAEAAGVAAWALRTAVEYAKVREQFGVPIGSFQAIKHICAQMLCRAETAAAVAWDAAEAAGDLAQHPLSAAVAGSVALEAAFANTKDCIQILGGIGFTWEHDAHLYLRRALTLRQLVGGTDRWRARAAELAAAGVRRALHVEVGGDRAGVRAGAEAVAAAADRRAALADSGYLVPHWPAPYGLGAGPELQLLVDEELERAGVTRPDLVIAGWALPTILAHGTPEQVERFVRPTLLGELTWCQLFSEPGAGSDLASLRTRAERVEGGWRLTGQKVWTSLADRADWGVCLARSNPDAPKHRGITYFLVDMRSPGIDIRPLREITGEPRFNEVFLDGVLVPDDLVVGEVDGGWALARTTLSHERVAMGGGSSIGDAVERLVAQAGPLAGRADVAVRIGKLVGEGLAGSVLDLRAVLRRLEGGDDAAAASVRKLIGVAHRQDVAECALDLAGADGLVSGEALQEFLLTRCLSIAGGTTQVLLNVAAERVLGLPRG